MIEVVDLENIEEEEEEEEEEEDVSDCDVSSCMMSALRTLPIFQRPLIFRCVIGGTLGVQNGPFTVASARVVKCFPTNTIVFETTSLSSMRKVKEQDLTLKTFMDWIAASHLHFIITHPHQGLEKFGWSTDDIYAQLWTALNGRDGFPSGRQLQCPIFTQDKIRYLNALPRHMTMRTLQVPLSEDMDLTETEKFIDDFFALKPDVSKYIIKAPFSTNSMHFKKFVTTSNAMDYIVTVRNDIFGPRPTCYVIPYLILQERVDATLANNKKVKEPKLVFLNGQFSHFCSTVGRSSINSLPGFSSDALIRFGETVLDLLDRELFILDGLVRVDLFLSNEGTLVLNELESLEAGTLCSDHVADTRTMQFLEEYWERKLHENIIKLFNQP